MLTVESFLNALVISLTSSFKIMICESDISHLKRLWDKYLTLELGCWTGFWCSLWWSLHGLIFRRCVRCGGSSSQRCLPGRGSVKPAGHWQRENGFRIQITHPCISASCKTAQFSPDTSANIYVHLSTLIPSVRSKTARSLRTYTHTHTTFFLTWTYELTNMLSASACAITSRESNMNPFKVTWSDFKWPCHLVLIVTNV